MAETCTVRVYKGIEWHRYLEPCGRTAKGELEGKPACGLHLTADRKRRERDAAREIWEARLDALGQVFGFVPAGFDVGKLVSCHISKLEKLAAELVALRRVERLALNTLTDNQLDHRAADGTTLRERLYEKAKRV